ncbi:uncharacterized protein EV154DRAFT_413263 [Mucor mucedo]|uniref:uncharacterized protein n=1 Tax=Mucor mucedo TaxID=29922 RepID=UPI00221F83BC|nr:uncharacterized protein EV154DRAFT_413263 [Mucor mucedo]KAI7895608.1 hypothetical protein EV154DRAFT_413263 [Mucor mucedo]
MSGSVPIVTGIIATALPTASGAQNNSVAALPTSGVYGNSVYPANAVFVTPTASKSVSPLYRIDNKENVTFAWSYSNLLVRPASLTMAAVAPNGVTYTIGTMAGDATTAVWQMKDVPAASPLMMGMYKVQLYDQRGVSATPQPGWLAPATTLTIAFYSAESYQPVTGSGYCPTCFYNAGKRVSESLGPIMMALGVACITSSMIIYGLLY